MPHNALRQALDTIAGRDAEVCLRMVAFQAQLLNSDAHALVRVAGGIVVEPANLGVIETRLALAAAVDGVAVEGNGAAALIDNDAGSARIVIHRLPQATPLSQALARERLELAAAVGRAHAAGDDPAFAATLAGFAAASWSPVMLTGLAAAMAAQASAPRLALVLLRRRRVVQVADSSAPTLADEARRRLELAAGEVADTGNLIVDAGNGGFTGLDRLAEGAAVRGIAVLSQDGDGVVALVWPPGDGARVVRHVTTLAPVVSARFQRPRLEERFETAIMRLPWPTRVMAVDRPRVARRLLVGLVAVIVLLPVPDSVSAPLTIEPLLRRAVTAPATARIEAVKVEPGDNVAAGQLLLRLDSQAIAHEREDAQSGLQAAAGEAARARADGDVDAERIAQFRVAQLAAQVALLDGRLAETEILAPIAGIVGGEDLRRRIGAGVNRGELLFTIAAAKGNRADMLVADSEIDRVATGQRISMALAARPLARISGTVTRIYPLAEVIDGRNVFRTVAAIDADDGKGLRPGMAGTASIRSSWSPIAWQALRAPLRWVRLKLWV